MNIFQYATPEERREIAQFMARKGVDRDLLLTFFDRADLQLDTHVNEEPQPEPILTRENIDPPNKKPRLDLDLNKSPRLELDLNQTPPAEQVEPDDGGGGGD